MTCNYDHIISLPSHIPHQWPDGSTLTHYILTHTHTHAHWQICIRDCMRTATVYVLHTDVQFQVIPIYSQKILSFKSSWYLLDHIHQHLNPSMKDKSPQQSSQSLLLSAEGVLFLLSLPTLFACSPLSLYPCLSILPDGDL